MRQSRFFSSLYQILLQFGDRFVKCRCEHEQPASEWANNPPHLLRTSKGKKERKSDMATRYNDRDEGREQRNYGRRSNGEYDRSYNQSSQSGYGRGLEDEGERYANENRWRGQDGGRRPYRSSGEYPSSREARGDYGNEGWESDYSNRDYGNSEPGRGYADYGLGHSGIHGGYAGGERGLGIGYNGAERGYTSRETRRGSERGRRGQGRNSDTSQRYNSPSSPRSSERYGERGRSDYGRGEYGAEEERGWWNRASDEVASWFGDEEAQRRRRMDEQRPHRGKGPKGYRRSDERIKEDINDRLSEGYIDATEIMVMVENGEVTLTGTVNSRSDKRRAEDIAEYVSGVSNVENRLRVIDDVGRYGSLQNTGATGTAAGTTASGTSSSTGTTARGRTAGS